MYVFIPVEKVLSTNTQRDAFLRETPPNYDKYYAPENLAKDAVIPPWREICAALLRTKNQLVFVTERRESESLRMQTKAWLQEELQLEVLPDEHLIMRTTGNLLNAAEWLRETLQQFQLAAHLSSADCLIIAPEGGPRELLADLGVVLLGEDARRVLCPSDTARSAAGQMAAS